jgi:hypothetical protein
VARVRSYKRDNGGNRDHHIIRVQTSNNTRMILPDDESLGGCRSCRQIAENIQAGSE